MQVCVITGGNAGIGFETATEMSKRGCHLILACRNMEKANTAAEVRLLLLLALPESRPSN